MKILASGNGFDLAHGLPTGYPDFLKWIVAEVEYWEDLKKQGGEIANGVGLSPLYLDIPHDKKGRWILIIH